MRQIYKSESLQQLFEKYSGLGAIKMARLYSSGFENSNFDVQTDAGRYVAKIFEGPQMTLETIKFEVDVMAKSNDSGVLTPRVYVNKANKLTSKFGEKLAIVMDHMPGENMERQSVSDSVVHEVGNQTGKMDKALEVFHDGSQTRQEFDFDLKTFKQLESKVDKLPTKYDRRILSGVFKNYYNIVNTFERLPTGLIHNDIAQHNILVYRGKLTGILDFSDMAFSPYIQNIAVPMAHLIFSHNWQPHQAKIFIDGYRNYHSLSSEELDILYELVQARYTQIIVGLNNWNLIYGKDEQRTSFVDDNYEFLIRFQGLGKKKFSKLIE